MRFAQIQRVLEIKLGLTNKSVMNVLAIRANPESFRVEMTYAELGLAAGVKESTLRKSIKTLEALSLIRVRRSVSRAHGSEFYINLPIIQRLGHTDQPIDSTKENGSLRGLDPELRAFADALKASGSSKRGPFASARAADDAFWSELKEKEKQSYKNKNKASGQKKGNWRFTGSEADWRYALGDPNSKFSRDKARDNWRPYLGPNPFNELNTKIPKVIYVDYGPKWGWVNRDLRVV
ncbi:MAG: hypothetical protein HWE39_05680 [Oceanospirillaceae bacterium]|nr:hypothetical protein [Oceanospirillaceae bacterium]